MFLNDILDKISDMRNGRNDEDNNVFIDPATGNAVTVNDDDPIAAKLYDESYDPDEDLYEDSEEKAGKFSGIIEHLPSINLSDKAKKKIPLIILIIIAIGYLVMNLIKFTNTAGGEETLNERKKFALGAKSFITTSDTLRLGLLYMRENKIITIGLGFSPPNLRVNIS